MVKVSKKKKRRKIKYRKLQFKVSDIQKKKLDDYCRYHGISLNKLFRRALKDYMDSHYDLPGKDVIHKNQMSIFDLDGVAE